MTSVLTPDELSELAEVLWDACAAAERAGYSILGFTPGKRSCCPFGALLLMDSGHISVRWPGRGIVATKTGLDPQLIDEFFVGVTLDGPLSIYGLRQKETGIMKLGRLFREQASRGGFS